jgi:hypothetical protein
MHERVLDQGGIIWKLWLAILVRMRDKVVTYFCHEKTVILFL